MRLKPIVTALCAGALLAASPFASAKELKAIGVTVGDLANPFFVQITKGAELEARKLAGDNVKVTLVSSGYDLGQQVAHNSFDWVVGPKDVASTATPQQMGKDITHLLCSAHV